MRTRAYVRESTVQQGEKFGPAAQRTAILQACRDLGLDAPTHWYTDLVTGTGKVMRDELRQAIAAAAAREYDVLVCYDTSRFARKERDAFNFEDDLARAGVRIYYAAERIWADDDAKALHKGVLHVINAEYSRALSRRVRDGIAAKRAKGGQVGSVPWGYRRSADLMRLEPDAGAAVRIHAWQRYATGEVTFATLADELNRGGYRIVWRGHERPFTRWTIVEFFRSRVDLEVGGLDPAIYERARTILTERATTSAKVALRRHAYLFAGVARCAECGESFWGRMSTNRHKPRPYAQLYHAPRGCRRGAHSEEKLVRQMGDWLQTWALPKDAVVRIARYVNRVSAEDDRASRRRQLGNELERVRNLYRWGDLGERDFIAQRSAIQHAIDALGSDIVARPPSREALQLASEIGTAWNAVSAPTRRRFIEEWFEQILVHRDGHVVVVPREAVRGIVYAAQVGIAGNAPALPTVPTFSVAGYAEWAAFWSDEASA